MTASSIAFEGTISEPLFLRAQRLYVGRRRLLLVLFGAAFTVGIWVTFSELPFLSKVLATVAAVALVPLIPVIQRRQWKRLYNRTPYLLDPIRGEVSDCPSYLKNSVHMNRRDLTSDELKKLEDGRNLTAKANELWLQGRFAETGPLYAQAVAIATDVLGQNSTEYSLAIRNLANLRYVQGKYAEAEELYRRALEIMEQELGPAHEDLVEVLTWLAEARFKNQQYDEAEEAYQRTVAILEQKGELALEELANVCMRLAHLYYFVGRYRDAEPQYLRALTTREQVLGPDHLDVARSAGQLARMYHLNPEFNKDAEPLYLRALRIEEKVLGENHPDTAECFYRLAGFYRDQQRSVEAAPLYKKAMSILDAHPELDELQTRWMRSGYAEFLREAGLEGQAAELEQRWGEWSAFEQMCRNEVRTRETTFGPDSPELATSLEHLAESCLFQEKYDEAEQHYLRALSIREAALGPDDSTIPASLSGLARIYRFREQYRLAEELIQRAARIYQNSVGKDSIEYGRTQEHLASLATEQQQPRRAEKLYELAVSTYRQIAGSESREYAEGLYHFAHFYARLSRFENAQAVLIKLMEIVENDIDVAELEKADYFELYASVLQELGRTEEAEVQLKRVEAIWAKERNE